MYLIILIYYLYILLFIKNKLNCFLIYKLSWIFLFIYLKKFLYWSSCIGVRQLLVPVIPISSSGAWTVSAVTKRQGCCLYSVFFRHSELCHQKPLVSSQVFVKKSICVSLLFCHRMCKKCWLTAFWVTAPPLFPRDRFVARLIYPTRHTGITFPAMPIYPEGGGWLVSVSHLNFNPQHQGRKYQILGWERKKAARLCVMEMLAWYLPIAVSQCPQTPLQKAIAALQLRVKGQNSLCAPAFGDGTLGSQQCTVNYMVFVWRDCLIQVCAWMCVYSWADRTHKFCSISIASYCSVGIYL